MFRKFMHQQKLRRKREREKEEEIDVRVIIFGASNGDDTLRCATKHLRFVVLRSSAVFIHTYGDIHSNSLHIDIAIVGKQIRINGLKMSISHFNNNCHSIRKMV